MGIGAYEIYGSYSTYNRLEALKNFIKSVLKKNYHNYELLIIDNASTNNTESINNNP